MAPVNAPAIASSAPANAGAIRTGSQNRPVARRRIEPAIPLPFVQRRPRQQPQPQPQPAVVQTDPTANRQSSLNENLPPASDQHTQTRVAENPASIASPALASYSGNSQPTDQTSAFPEAPEEEKRPVPVQEAAEYPRQAEQQPPPPTVPGTQSATEPPSLGGEVTPPGMNSYQGGIPNALSRLISGDVPSAPSSATQQQQPTISPPLPQMHPSYYPPPANPRIPFRGPIPEPIRLPSHALNNQPRMHQQHPSSGSLIFGGFYGSNSSSPAPNSGGFPPPMPAPMLPYPRPNQPPATTVDEYGRPLMATAPFDGQGRPPSRWEPSQAVDHGFSITPMTPNHGPNTPRSFQGSQSSRQAEEGRFNNGYPTANGHVNNEGLPRGLPLPSAPPQPDLEEMAVRMAFEDQVAILDSLSSLFARPEFADCELCLDMPEQLTSSNSQMPGQPNRPLRLPAHRLVLFSNGIMRRLMAEQQRHLQTHERAEIHVPASDPYLRADAFWTAIEYLYGKRAHALHPRLPPHIEKEPDSEKFRFALGLASAGALLQIPRISVSAVSLAGHCLNWDTVETGLAFALKDALVVPGINHPDNLFPEFQYRYGMYDDRLVQKILDFIMTHFPRNFALEANLPDPEYARLPPMPFLPPVVAQLSKIQFGDMAPAKTETASSPGGYEAALSRILVNLPYPMLKYVLENSGLGNISGWMTTEDRHRVMSHVVAEREQRRLRFVAALKSGKVEGPVASLQKVEPQLLEGPWNNVGWREECVQEAPIITRSWMPLR